MHDVKKILGKGLVNEVVLLFKSLFEFFHFLTCPFTSFHFTSFPFPSMSFKVKDFPNPKTTKYASISHFIYNPHGAGLFTNHFPNLSNIECPTILSFIGLNHLKLHKASRLT